MVSSDQEPASHAPLTGQEARALSVCECTVAEACALRTHLSAPVEEDTIVFSHSERATALLAALRTLLTAATGDSQIGEPPTKGLSSASVADSLRAHTRHAALAWGACQARMHVWGSHP